MIHPDLTIVKQATRRAADDGVRLFACMRNEELRLPFFLDYYRRLGIQEFFIIDNGSNDGTAALLAAQDDCHVFYSDAPFAKANAGMDWFNALLHEYAVGHWTIIADADELFVFPHCEQRDINQFCRWLDAGGYRGVFAPMLDMYDDKPLSDVAYRAGVNFLDVCRFFDGTYRKRKRLRLPFMKQPFPRFEYFGGPRHRLCFPLQSLGLWPMRWAVLLLSRFGLATTAPLNYKIPLVKWGGDLVRNHPHRCGPLALAPVTGAVLHFKYFQDFAVKVLTAVREKNHFKGSAEYRHYAKKMLRDPKLSLIYAGSVAYETSGTLVGLGLIEDDAGWRASA